MFEVVQFQDRLQRETIMPTIGEIDWRDRFESNDRIKGSKYHDDSLMGYGGNDTIDGEAGNDTLDGGADHDMLNGGAGMDLLHGRDGLDTLDGGEGSDTLDGGSGADRLDGGSGHDDLDGGSGADTMAGSIGDDRYFVDQVGDMIRESRDEGRDRVFSSISYKLGPEVEGLVLLEGSGATHGSGNDLDNQIDGNSLDNTLSGGAGDDHLIGSWGADLLRGENGNDAMIPGSAWNFLDPDMSADTMIGGIGNDSYLVVEASDLVIENGNGGNDLVVALIDYTLDAHVENLHLTYGRAINGTGNAGGNTILGNSENNGLYGEAGDDWLDGSAGADTVLGGAGNDTLTGYTDGVADVLTGGGDADMFWFYERSGNADTITDFVSGTDRIAIDSRHLGTGTGTLAANGITFVLGSSAVGAGPTVMFDATTHQVLADADGTGAGSALVLATLTGVATVSASDFLIV
jgi:Ca2+-binding RTX toxin-like protein